VSHTGRVPGLLGPWRALGLRGAERGSEWGKAGCGAIDDIYFLIFANLSWGPLGRGRGGAGRGGLGLGAGVWAGTETKADTTPPCSSEESHRFSCSRRTRDLENVCLSHQPVPPTAGASVVTSTEPKPSFPSPPPSPPSPVAMQKDGLALMCLALDGMVIAPQLPQRPEFWDFLYTGA
jgi:hypothetical protein